jgi:hypothetical protein
MSAARQAARPVNSRIASHCIVLRAISHRTAPPSRTPPLHLLLQRQQKATEAQAHTLPPVTSAHCAFEDADEDETRRAQTRQPYRRPPPLPPSAFPALPPC